MSKVTLSDLAWAEYQVRTETFDRTLEGAWSRTDPAVWLTFPGEPRRASETFALALRRKMRTQAQLYNYPLSERCPSWMLRMKHEDLAAWLQDLLPHVLERNERSSMAWGLGDRTNQLCDDGYWGCPAAHCKLWLEHHHVAMHRYRARGGWYRIPRTSLPLTKLSPGRRATLTLLELKQPWSTR